MCPSRISIQPLAIQRQPARSSTTNPLRSRIAKRPMSVWITGPSMVKFFSSARMSIRCISAKSTPYDGLRCSSRSMQKSSPSVSRRSISSLNFPSARALSFLESLSTTCLMFISPSGVSRRQKRASDNSARLKTSPPPNRPRLLIRASRRPA